MDNNFQQTLLEELELLLQPLANAAESEDFVAINASASLIAGARLEANREIVVVARRWLAQLC